jgi:hypothetical protein
MDLPNKPRYQFGIHSALFGLIITFLSFCEGLCTMSRAGEIVSPGRDAFFESRGMPLTFFSGFKQSSATGYCTSSGGSTQYEAIRSIDLTPNPDGTYLLEVDVYISNPTNCKPGEPCSSYDPSPEYVNAWIDWNGDKTWDSSEKVMDAALTGYGSINYYGTMTAVTQFSPPDPSTVTKDPTWMRVNLGWRHDPDNPCEETWTYGNVVDKEFSPAVVDIKIKNIVAKGRDTTNNLPETGSVVGLEAQIEVPEGYEITKCNWTGDLTPGEGNAAEDCYYEYTPATGVGPSTDTYGNKMVTLTITYARTGTGVSGTLSKDYSYKVFFARDGDDDGDDIPNWLEYWGANGAVPQLNQADVRFDKTMGPNTYGCYNCKGDDIIDLGGGAAKTHYPNGIYLLQGSVDGIYCPGGTFGGAQGIDCATEVIEHEGRHKWVRHNWDAGGIWTGKANSDFKAKGPTDTRNYDDSLPDDYEIEVTGTSPNAVDSCLLELRKGKNYKYYGDNEYAVMLYSNGKTGNADKDWANPGKQPPAAASMTELDADQRKSNAFYSGSGPVDSRSLYHAFTAASGPFEMTSFSGTYSDSGVDTDGNGLYNQLKVSIKLQIEASDLYTVVAWLKDGSGNDIAWASTQGQLSAGKQTVNLYFDGPIIRSKGINGPYKIARVELREGNEEELIDAEQNVHTTAAYHYTDFDTLNVSFTKSFSDSGVDKNSDSLYDLLTISVGLNVQKAGTYDIIGELRKDTQTIAVARTKASLSAGAQTVNLEFNGPTIYQQRLDGPYALKALRIEDASKNKMDTLQDAYTTKSYTYSQFQHSGTAIDGSSYQEQALDLNSDSLYDYLRISFKINVAEAGFYRLSGILKDSKGESISTRTREINLATGENSVNLDFLGKDINGHKVDGPYQVTSVTLIGPNNTVVDTHPKAYTTKAYKYTDFAGAVLSLTGPYSDYGQDTDNNTLYNYLIVEIKLTPSIKGMIKAQGQLVDKNGKGIAWAENTKEMEAGVAQAISLSFDGKLIRANGIDGPYDLNNLYIYHTGYPDQAISLSKAYTTSTYSYQKFEGTGGPYTLTVIKSGTGGGTVTSSPAGINCGTDCTEAYNQDTVVTLTAAPSAGSTFAGWSGACSGTGTCSVAMDSNKTVTATFNQQGHQYTLTVIKSGTGGGTVTSSPAGINCGTDCTEAYNQGTAVTLTATPSAGSTFAGWSGACSGTGTCSVTMNDDKIVTATFTLNQKPNLTPYQPKGWSDKIVVSNVTGALTDTSPLKTTHMLYVNWAVINQSSVDITTGFYVSLFVDGMFKDSWYFDSLNANYYGFGKDYSIGQLGAGNHILKIVADSDQRVGEDSEIDNEYAKTITVLPEGPSSELSNLRPYQPQDWSDAVVVSTSKGIRTDSLSYTDEDTLYISWAVLNDGPAATPGGFSVDLYIDGMLEKTWSYSTPLKANYYRSVTDYSIGKLSGGFYTFEIVVDPDQVISESNEEDNEYMKDILVEGILFYEALPNLTAYQPGGWPDKIVVSSSRRDSKASNSFTPQDTLYVDWAVINNGEAGTSQRVSVSLYVDGVLKKTWKIPPLKGSGVEPFSTSSSMQKTYYTIKRYPIGKLGWGDHTLTIVIDPKGVLREKDKEDNQYNKTIQVLRGP